MSALEDHPIDPIKKKRLGRHSNSVLPTWGICNFRLNGKGAEDQGKKNKVAPFEKKPKGHPLWGPNCCEPLRVQMSHCSLFELARVPNRTCRHLICSDSKEVPKVTRRLWHVSPCLHSGYTALLHKILHLSFPVCFHPSLLFSLFLSPLRALWLSPHACIYIGGTALEKWLKSCPVDQGGLWGLSML